MQREELLTVFCMFSREWLIERWIADFEHAMAKYDHSQINLVFIIDIDFPEIEIRLKQMHERGGYRSYQVEINRDHEPSAANISIRRRRIARLKEQSKRMIAAKASDYVLSFEDDSAFADIQNFDRLFEAFETFEGLGIASGVECGRWNWKYVGAWEVDDYDDPSIAWTVKPKTEGYQEVDATGFYCYLTPTKLYLGHNYHWNDNDPWGADVNYGIWVRQQGYTCVVDWATPIDHNSHNVLLKVFDEQPIETVCYTRNDDNTTWRRDDERSPAY